MDVVGLGQVTKNISFYFIKYCFVLFFNLGIIWIYNLIWFIPLDFIKFGLQAVFHRSLHTVKPFEHIHRRLLASKQANASVAPLDMADEIANERRASSKPPLEPESTTDRSTVLEQVTQFGASFYSPYTDTLSHFTKLNPLLRRVELK